MPLSPDPSVEVRPPRSAHTPGLLARMKGMLLAPKQQWSLIAGEGVTLARLYRDFVVPIAILGALFAFIRVSIVGTAEPLTGTVRVPVSGGLITSLMVFASGLSGIFIVSLIIDVLAPFFGAVRDRRLAAAIAAYASTPIWVAILFAPFPTLWPPLQLLAVGYHTYLLYLGLTMLMKAARDRVLGYATTVVLCTILLEIMFTMASAGLGGATHMNPYRAFG